MKACPSVVEAELMTANQLRWSGGTEAVVTCWIPSVDVGVLTGLWSPVVASASTPTLP